MPTQKSALITGASRGIGKAIAYEFARNGYNLYLTCKNNLDLLKDLKHEIENIESKIHEIIFLNPNSEIVVICTPKCNETLTILDKLSNDYTQLHIIK